MADTGKSNPRDPQGRGSRNRPHSSQSNKQYPLDPEVAAKLKEIESSGEPMSIAEAISRERKPATESSDNSALEGEVINVTELQKMSVEDLTQQALSEGISDANDLGKRDLITRMLKERVKARGIMCGQGTLQILPDGFGFLRSPEYPDRSENHGPEDQDRRDVMLA